jgi:hypothetical protein
VSKKKSRKRLHFRNFRPNIPLNDRTAVAPVSSTLRDVVPQEVLAPSEESARSTSKVEGKDSQLPVTDSALELRPGFVRLFSPLDTKSNQHSFLWWITEQKAAKLLREREVEKLHYTRRRIRSVNLVAKSGSSWPASSGPAIPDPDKPASLRRQGMGDSHDREREDNPAGVWTIDSIPSPVTPNGLPSSRGEFTEEVFDAVLISLLLPRAHRPRPQKRSRPNPDEPFSQIPRIRVRRKRVI